MKSQSLASGFRWIPIVVLSLGTLATMAMQVSADEAMSLEEGQRFVEVGQLAQVRGRTAGTMKYVLLDQHGEVISSLRPAEDIDLQRYVGQEVGVTARTLVDGDTPVLLAEHVTTFGKARQLSPTDLDGEVALASHTGEVISTLGAGATSSVLVDTASSEYLMPTPMVADANGYPTTGADVLTMQSYEPGVVGTSCGVPGCAECGLGCGDINCRSCAACPCGLPGRFWIRGESLIWWTKGMNTPPLLVSSPLGTTQRNAGVAGIPGNVTLFGGQDLFEDSRSGGRFRIGKWCDRYNLIGWETDFFFLNSEDQQYLDNSVANPIIGRPFIDAVEGPSSELIDFPGLVAGTVEINAETSLWSINPRLRVNLSCENFATPTRHNPCAMGGYRFDMLVGYRYMQLEDDLSIRETLIAPTADANGQIPLIPRFDNVTYFDIRDSFSTSNEFHGADIGFAWEGYRGRWSLELLSKIGIGSTNQEVSIRGNTARTQGNNSDNVPGGLLALESNIGTYSRDEFTVLPEFGATLGYALSPRMRFLVGYSFLYWNNVVRAGDQIDTTINTEFLPDVADPITGPNRPAFSFADTSFWAQGVSLGLDYRW